MLLHDDESEADAMNKGEIEEIFQLCQIQKSWTVVEWAAGMGRLTPLLAAQSRFVYASDFVQSFCDTNARNCAAANITNVQVDCIDGAEYAPTAEGNMPHRTDAVDLCFVNWLLLYLDDAHAEKFLRAARDSLRCRITPPLDPADAASSVPPSHDGSGSGLIFLHESCWERSNEGALFDALSAEEQARILSTPWPKTEDCQTYYRTSVWYEALFERLGLEVVKAHELSVYKNFGSSEEGEGEANGTSPAAAGAEAEASGAVAAPVATTDAATEGAAAATSEPSEDDYYNKQMTWLLRIKPDAGGQA
jgi:hypothetical protein